jgi:ketosteroid isomerase-like protein
MKKLYVLLFSSLLLISCSNNNKKNKLDSPTDAKTLMDESMQRFANAWNQGNAAMLSEEFTIDAVRIISNPMSPIIGKNAILKSFESTFSDESELYKSHIEISVVEARSVSTDIFLGTGIFKILDKNNNVLEDGKWENVFKYADGKIKFLLESAHRNSQIQTEAENVSIITNSIDSEALHFEKIKTSVSNYIKYVNDQNAEDLSLLFSENGIQNVSSKEGIILGRDNIRNSEIFLEGHLLNANITGYKYLENSLAIAYGKWSQTDENTGEITTGQWGNLFKIEGENAFLIMESAGLN